MLITHKKLQPMQCYHIFSDSRDVYLAKNHYGSYSPHMVPGSWPIWRFCKYANIDYVVLGIRILQIRCNNISWYRFHNVTICVAVMQIILMRCH